MSTNMMHRRSQVDLLPPQVFHRAALQSSHNNNHNNTARRRRPLMLLSMTSWLQQRRRFSWNQVLFVTLAGYAAQLVLGMYLVAWDHDNQQQHANQQQHDNPNANITDWTISNVMAQPYNQPTAYYRLFPAFMTLILLFARQFWRQPGVRRGTAIGLVAAPAVFYFDICHHKTLHLLSTAALLVGLFQATARQHGPGKIRNAVRNAGLILAVTLYICREWIWDSAVVGLGVGVGEMMILVAWASMIFNDSGNRQELPI